MTKQALLVIMLLFVGALQAQLPKIDITAREELLAQKAKHYQQLSMCQQQQTLNQQAYNITYYALDLTPDPSTATLHGSVTVAASVTAPTLDRVELNFWGGLTITNIHPAQAAGIPLTYDWSDDLLTIHLEKAYLQNQIFRITIEYHGRPQNYGYPYFHFDTYNNQPMIWSMSSVFGARTWWPCKDIPSDKPDSVDIRVTVPGNLIVASNGDLRQVTVDGNQKTYWWHEGYPIATYLISLAIHPYKMHYDYYLYNNDVDTVEIQFYHFPGNYDAHYRINALVRDMIGFYSDLFGPYPFAGEKYGQADFLWSGGMEHQTCTSYGSWSEILYAHEIAHQWWGDMITCDDFHHIWLNEGFASYCEALWFEHAYPPLTASDYQMMYQLYLGPGTVYVEHPEYENIFDSGLSYVKASWVLHMLRHVVGDEVFIDILRAYYASAEHKFATATTEGFRVICEQVSGMNLGKFFYQWIYEENYPHYEYTWSWSPQGSDYLIDLQIRQLQGNYIFTMPIDVTITTAQGETTLVVHDSLATQSFQFQVSSEPIRLQLDKDDWILKRMPEQLVNPTFDRGILLVNGVLFETYADEIYHSYQNRAFWGDFPITFWDCFYPPPGGYPATLPMPIGYGKVTPDVLGQFSTVIWVGNNYAGDLGSWQQTSILPYLRAGGNVLLMTRQGQDYIDAELRDYLGITWAEHPQTTINNCLAVYPGLADMPLTDIQSLNAVFDTDLKNNESALLFRETATFSVPRGLGVWRKPTLGGEHRSDGGQFVFISGRPYRYDAARLRANVAFILRSFFNEVGSSSGASAKGFRLEQNYP
ncbi:M1 family metallopeptidase, partial [candidate division KSB1 bacterium]|nr:M1 family metallopeptidase [candidate division KSB1 bacterium]